MHISAGSSRAYVRKRLPGRSCPLMGDNDNPSTNHHHHHHHQPRTTSQVSHRHRKFKAMLSYHGQRAGGRTRFAIAVNHPSRPAPAATSLARRPSFDRDSPDPVSGPLSRDANISDPNLDILLPPLPAPTSVIDCSPLTPPSSSQVTSSSISPPGVHQPSPVVEPPRFPNLLAPPSTWEALNHRIEAFALSRITAPCITPMNDDLWASFVDNLETCDRSSALCRLR